MSSPVTPLFVHDLISINTQELESLLEEEQEYFEAVEEFEHGVGINNSIVDWFNVFFQSSFSSTGEFDQRLVVVVQPSNCEDCKVSSVTFEKNRKLLLKQGELIQDRKRTEKESNEEIKELKSTTKSLESRLEETTNMLETILEETTAEITLLKSQLKNKSVAEQPKIPTQFVKDSDYCITNFVPDLWGFSF